MTHIAIVTINFNSEKETHACLASLRKVITPDIILSLIVVDNASQKPFTILPEEKQLSITLLRSEVNLGFSGGNNLGMQHALKQGAGYVMLLNNDTYVQKDILVALLAVAEASPEVGLVVPKIYFAAGHEFHKSRYTKQDVGKVIWYAGGGTDWNNVMSFHRGVDEVDHGQYDKNEQTAFASGCCMFFKKEVLEKVGLFDTRYFLYFEDADMTERVQRAGYRIMYAPQAMLWHVNAASSGVGSTLHDYFITRNRMLFGFTYASLRAKVALFRESVTLLRMGRKWQKKGIRDFYIRKFGKGSYV